MGRQAVGRPGPAGRFTAALVGDPDLGIADAGFVVLLALLGGAFGRLFTGGIMLTIVKLLPSYWLVQAGQSASRGGGDWPLEGWIVLALWVVALVPLAVLAYRRDTSRV